MKTAVAKSKLAAKLPEWDRTAIRTRIEKIARRRMKLSAADSNDLAFHLTAWLDELNEYFRFCTTPSEMTDREVFLMLRKFIAKVPDHVAASDKICSGTDKELLQICRELNAMANTLPALKNTLQKINPLLNSPQSHQADNCVPQGKLRERGDGNDFLVSVRAPRKNSAAKNTAASPLPRQ